MSAFDREACKNVLNEVLHEHNLLHESYKYVNMHDFPDGTSEFYFPEFDRADKNVLQQHEQGTLTWRDLMMRAAIGATCETDPEGLRGELLDLASLVVEWIEAIDRRDAHPRRFEASNSIRPLARGVL